MPYKDADARRAYARQWVARRRAAWLEGKVCVQCGSADSLELDHRDRRQKVNHRLWSWSAERREAELAKCQVLCRPCHFAKSKEVGDFIHRGRLTPDQVEAIRNLYKQEKQMYTAQRFGISQQHVSDIQLGRKISYVMPPSSIG